MTRKILTLTLAGVLCMAVACALSIPLTATAQSPVGDALATLAAATAQAQMIRQAQEATYAAQRATIQAVMVEQTRTAAQARATEMAVSAQATQSALDELQRQRAMTATAQRAEIIATGTALAQSAQATASAEVLSVQATTDANHAAATAQVALWSEQATAVARQNETANLRQERFSVGLLIVEFGFVIGALLIISWLTRSLVLWAKRLAPQPVNDALALTEVLTAHPERPTVINQSADPAEPHTLGSQSRLPAEVQVFEDPRMVEALNKWANRYDAEHGVGYGN